MFVKTRRRNKSLPICAIERETPPTPTRWETVRTYNYYTMLTLINITKSNFFNSANEKEKDKADLVVLHFTDCEDEIMAATFAANDYALTGNLLKLTKSPEKNKHDEIDLERTFDKVCEEKCHQIVKSAYGFTFAISELIEGVAFVTPKSDEKMEIATRRVIGLGKDEESARKDALQREIGRLRFGIAKGTLIPHYIEEEADEDEG